MLRSIIRASSSAAPRVARFSVRPAVASALSTRVAVASRSFSDKSAVATRESNSVASPNVTKMKALLSSTIQNDLDQLDMEPGEDLSNYIRDKQFKILTNPTGGIIVSRVIEGYNVATYFDSSPDNEGDMDENEDGEGEEGEEGEGESEGGEANSQHSHSFDIDISPVNPNPKSSQNFLRVTAYVDAEGVLCIESFGFNPKADLVSGALGGPRDLTEAMAEPEADEVIFFDNLENDLQDQMIDWLAQLGVDDQFAQFVAAYSVVVRTQVQAKKYKSLQEFFKN